MKAYIYINPNAPAEVKDLVAEHFSDVSRVSSVFMQEVTGGFVDEGPPLSAYAAVLLDEEGELHLLEPVIFGRLHRGARAIGDQFSPKVIIPNAMSPWEKNGASCRISNDES